MISAGLFLALIFQARDVGADMKTLGAVEQVLILPWKVKLSARIDTGASSSSLHAQDIHVKDDHVEFKLAEPGGSRQVNLPLHGWRRIRTSGGGGRRPAVRVQLCIGGQLISATVNLIDRSGMNYPLLIGRDVLANRFVVDVSQHNMTSLDCPKGDVD